MEEIFSKQERFKEYNAGGIGIRDIFPVINHHHRKWTNQWAG